MPEGPPDAATVPTQEPKKKPKRPKKRAASAVPAGASASTEASGMPMPEAGAPPPDGAQPEGAAAAEASTPATTPKKKASGKKRPRKDTGATDVSAADAGLLLAGDAAAGAAAVAFQGGAQQTMLQLQSPTGPAGAFAAGPGGVHLMTGQSNYVLGSFPAQAPGSKMYASRMSMIPVHLMPQTTAGAQGARALPQLSAQYIRQPGPAGSWNVVQVATPQGIQLQRVFIPSATSAAHLQATASQVGMPTDASQQVAAAQFGPPGAQGFSTQSPLQSPLGQHPVSMALTQQLQQQLLFQRQLSQSLCSPTASNAPALVFPGASAVLPHTPCKHPLMATTSPLLQPEHQVRI